MCDPSLRQEIPIIHKIYRSVVQCICQDGHAPTVREIQRTLNVPSLGHIHHHLMHLARQGLLTHHDHLVRGLRAPLLALSRESSTTVESLCVEVLPAVAGHLKVRVATNAYQAVHICAGDVLTITPSPLQDALLLLVLHDPLFEGTPQLVIVQAKAQEATNAYNFIPFGEGTTGAPLSCLEWERDWVVLGSVARIWRTLPE
jgi:hypothetical protein